MQLHQGNCLDVMANLPAGSIDAIITDLPYGKINCPWDAVIPIEPMWACLLYTSPSPRDS